MTTKAAPRKKAKTQVTSPPPPPMRRRRGSRPIGPFAYLVMKMITKLNRLGSDQAYGLNIDEHLTNELRAIVDLAQVYVVCKRLENRGFVSKKTMVAPSGSGHDVIVYTVTPAGAEAMATAGLFYQHLTTEEEPQDVDVPQEKFRRRGTRSR